jgi:PAS domain S-box-containing protein
MKNEKVLILHRNRVILDKLAQNIRNSGFSTITATDVESTLNFAQSLKPDFVIWGEELTIANKKAIRRLKNMESGQDIAVIALSNGLELYDRIEAQQYGIDDFFPAEADYSELKLRLFFHLNNMQRLRSQKSMLDRYKGLSQVTFNLLTSEDGRKICELAAEYILTHFPAVIIVLGLTNDLLKDFEYLGIYSDKRIVKLDTKELKNHSLWRKVFLEKKVTESGEYADPAILNTLRGLSLLFGKVYTYPLKYKNAALGGILMVTSSGNHLSREDEIVVATLCDGIASRLGEIKRISGHIYHEAQDHQEEINGGFPRINENEIFTILCKKLLGILQADICLYLNYNEGFHFLSPNYLLKNAEMFNKFESEKSPVFLMNDFPTFTKLLTLRKSLIIDTTNNRVVEDLSKLPGFDKNHFQSIIILQVTVANSIQGFIILGKEKVLKKYVQSDIEACERLVQSAAIALEECRLLKDAKLTIKQLNRIFDLGKELTLDISVSDILNKIGTAIRRTLGWNIVIVDKYNTFDDVYETVTVLGMKKEDYRSSVCVGESAPYQRRLEKSLKIHDSYFYDDAQAHTHDKPLTKQEYAIQIGSNWRDNDWIYLPIESRGKRLGMISLNDPVERLRPTEDRIKSIEYFAHQAAVVLENAQLFERLKSSELKYRLLAETMIMGLVTCDFSGKILYLNQSLFKLLKVDSENFVLEHSIFALCDDPSAEKMKKMIKKMQANDDYNKVEKSLEINLRTNDEESIPFMLHVSPLVQQDRKTGFLGVLTDLRDQKRLERLKSDFNSMIVHDLRSPLNIIQGYVDIVRSQITGTVTGEQEELLDIIKDNVYKILKLIDSFLISSKLEAGKFKISPDINSVNMLTESILEQHKSQVVRKNLALQQKLDNNIPLLSFDKFRIEQVITNLLSNAIKFSKEGGTITVITKLCKKKQVSPDEIEMYVEVSVADNGVGISEKELLMVFNKYEMTEAGKNAALKGTGLGLAICKEIIELHQGEIWVESKLGEGSTFYFTLPIRPIKLAD